MKLSIGENIYDDLCDYDLIRLGNRWLNGVKHTIDKMSEKGLNTFLV